jgi:hypothetical protein
VRGGGFGLTALPPVASPLILTFSPQAGRRDARFGAAQPAVGDRAYNAPNFFSHAFACLRTLTGAVPP